MRREVFFAALAVTAAACGSDDSRSGDIKIALLAPKSGPLAFVGDSFEKVANIAVANMNERGGIDGRDLVLDVRDTQTTPDVAAQRLQDLVDEGFVAVVGPATSGEVEAAFPVAFENATPIMSPSSTQATLSDTNDGGYMFRNVPDDNIQGIAMAYYLAQQRSQPITEAYVMYESTGYGAGLAGSFRSVYEKPSVGGAVLGEVTFGQQLQALCCPAATACPTSGSGSGCVLQPIAPGVVACGTMDDPTVGALPKTCQGPEAIAVIDDLVAQSPTPQMVVVVALEQDALQLVLAWDNSGSPRIPGLQFFQTDGARSTGYRSKVPSSVYGMCGTAPTYPTDGVAYQALADAYAAAYGGADVGQEVYAPNVWDGFHLFGAALLQQQHAYPDEDVGGEHLRDAVTEVSRQGQIRRSDEWRNLILDIRAGNDVDYDGAAGPNDLLGNGQAIGPYEVWCISADGTSFEQARFFTAEEIQAL